MTEITGPVIATTLVLLAVFVPTAFMGGITGQLYRQFALTISGAVVISTINALTLSPALCGILLRPSGENRTQSFFLFRWFNKGFDADERLCFCDPEHGATRGVGVGTLSRARRPDRVELRAIPDWVFAHRGSRILFRQYSAPRRRFLAADPASNGEV